MTIASAEAREHDTPALRRPEPALSPKQRQRRLRQVRTAENARAAKAAQAQRDANIEKADERLAPAAQRKPVLAPDGTVLYHPRLERDGVIFKRCSPLTNAVQRGASRTEAGLTATSRHDPPRAADRLSSAGRDAGEGIHVATSSYGERAGGTPQTGFISDGVLAAVAHQRRASIEIEAAKTWLVALWPVIHDVALRGMDMAAWAEAKRFDTKAGPGYISAALDRLVEFYREKQAPNRQALRSVFVGPRRQA